MNQADAINALGKWDSAKIATAACFLLLGFSMWQQSKRGDQLSQTFAEMDRKQAEFYARLVEENEKFNNTFKLDVSQEERVAVALETAAVNGSRFAEALEKLVLLEAERSK